jgi:multidrug resistance efflux pump
LAGVVVEVRARVGGLVQRGDLLFRLDDRDLRAQLAVKEAQVAVAQAQLARIQQLPRPEELPPSAAKVAEAEARLMQAEDELARGRILARDRIATDEQLVAWEQNAAVLRQQLARARGEHALLQAGAWSLDVDVLKAQLEQHVAERNAIAVDLDRLEIRAPCGGTVLKVDVRPGEYVASTLNRDLVVLGDLSELHVRVDLDEHDVPRLGDLSHARVRATLRGDGRVPLPLEFVRIEPYVVPKKSLTGDNTERVDTRVLQVIFRLCEPRPGIFVGQQMDVEIERVGQPAADAALTLAE